ncbi:MAG: ketol-acid reductoisomerase [Fuerstiella sp.]|nr:ketol-acid reductoisomerase [Fuerstiella sp.]
MQLLRDDDVSQALLDGKTVSVLGYGNQGRAQALNLRDSGVQVVIGNRDDEYRDLAVSEGFEPVEIPEAAAAGDILLVLTTDEAMPLIWDDQIAPGIEAGNVLCWGSGYNVGFEVIRPSVEADWIMIAPMMPGNVVRTRYEQGQGVISQFAVERDSTGNAREIALALCKGMGLTRAGVYQTSFRGEAELNLYTEQVVWAGLAAWLQFCFELAVENGIPPENVVMALYASTESSEIMGLMAEHGFYKQMKYHSTTSQYGTLTRAGNLISKEVREQARHNLVNDIQGGAFVKEWTQDNQAASKRLEQFWQKALAHPMSLAEDRVIQMIQDVNKTDTDS